MDTLVPTLVTKYAPMLLILAALVVADIASGLLSALKRGVFDWQQLADTYRTTIIPKIGGWVVVTFLIEAATFATALPAVADQIINALGAYGSFALVVADLLASVLANLQELSAPVPPTPSGPLPTESVADLRARR